MADPYSNRPAVSFVGAGPGDPELVTLKAARRIAEADLVLYAGSLVPRTTIQSAKDGATIADSSSMTLEETHAMMMETVRRGGMVARVHTGDPSLYGAVREQAALLDKEGVSYEIVPGVTAAFAAAAAARVGLTEPERTQTLVITRLAGRTPVPERERLASLAAHGCTIAVYLSGEKPEDLHEELHAAGLDDETRIVVAHKVGQPEETIHHARLGDVPALVRDKGLTRQTVYLVLPWLAEGEAPARSRLYAPDFGHGWREADSTDD